MAIEVRVATPSEPSTFRNVRLRSPYDQIPTGERNDDDSTAGARSVSSPREFDGRTRDAAAGYTAQATYNADVHVFATRHGTNSRSLRLAEPGAVI